MRPVLAALVLCAAAVSADTPGEPVLHGEAALALDVDTREVVYSRDIDRRLYPASTTKLLTAILLAEHRDPGHLVRYTEEAAAAYPYRLDLEVGDLLPAAEAMKAILLFSGNDVAVAVAQDVAGSVTEFARLMNAKAASLGMTGSHFTNPTGLHEPEHYTTAYDLSLLARALYAYPWVMEVTPLAEATVAPLGGEPIPISNRNKLAGIRGCVAGKTGWTTPAGRCLVALYERDGRRMVGVVMRSLLDAEDTVVFEDMETLISWSYAARRTEILPAGAPAARVTLSYDLLGRIGPSHRAVVPLAVRTAVEAYPFSDRAETSVQLTGSLFAWRLRRDRPAGALVLVQREREDRYELYPQFGWTEILRRHLRTYIAVAGCAFAAAALAGVLVSLGGRGRPAPG